MSSVPYPGSRQGSYVIAATSALAQACENQFSHGLGHNGPPNHVRAGGSIFRKQPSLAGGRSRCRPASFIASTRYRVDERRILMGMSAGGYGQRLAMRLRAERRRAHAQAPKSEWAQSLRPQTLAMLPRLRAGRLGFDAWTIRRNRGGWVTPPPARPRQSRPGPARNPGPWRQRRDRRTRSPRPAHCRRSGSPPS